MIPVMIGDKNKLPSELSNEPGIEKINPVITFEINDHNPANALLRKPLSLRTCFMIHAGNVSSIPINPLGAKTMAFKTILNKLLRKLLPNNFSANATTPPVMNEATFLSILSNGFTKPEINIAGKKIGNAIKPTGNKLIKIAIGIKIKPGKPSDNNIDKPITVENANGTCVKIKTV